MNTFRSNARVAGALLITAAAAGILSLPFSGLINEADYLVRVAGNENRVVIAALLELIMAFACAGIAIWLYPALRRQNEAMALGSVIFRGIEAVCFIVAATILMTTLTLGQEFVKAGTSDAAYFQTLGDSLLAARDWASYVFGAIAFGLGALLYYYLFYQSRLIPRWLSGWGLVAITLHIAAALLVMFGQDPLSPASLVLNLPILGNELVLAAWLIVKGFDSSALASSPVKQI